MANEDIPIHQLPVSDTDQLSAEGGRDVDHARRVGEFSPTNSPLSAAEIDERKRLQGKKRKRGQPWTPRTVENIHEIKPLKEKDPSAR
jgi:hypothetical protein